MLSNIVVPVLMATAAIAAPEPAPLQGRSTGGKVNNGAIANWNNSNIKDGNGSGKNEYHMYWGNGTPGAGWPDKSQWASFEDMLVCHQVKTTHARQLTVLGSTPTRMPCSTPAMATPTTAGLKL